MNLTRLQTFVEVVRRGTFAGAADALSFTPSAVSQQMTKLEAETGTSLLVREAGGVRLTEAGRLLHEHAIAIVEAVRHAQAQLEALEAEQVKRLRLGACPVAAGAVLPRALRLLRRRLPTAELLLEEAAAEDTRWRCSTGGWRSASGSRPATRTRIPRLVETVLRREPLCAAIPADHPLTRARRARRRGARRHAADRRRSRGGSQSLRTVLALVAAGEGWAPVPARRPSRCPPGVALRPLAGAPEWELRAARPAGEVLSVGTLAAHGAPLRPRERRSRRRSATLVARRRTRSGRSPTLEPLDPAVPRVPALGDRRGASFASGSWPRRAVARMRLTILLAAAALALGVAACGSDDESSSPTRPEPVAQVDQLSGRTTAVTLDAGFVEALTVAQAHARRRSARRRSARPAWPRSRSRAAT